MAILPSILLFAAGCGDSEIKTYRIAKEDNTTKVPVHSADDGHDHSGHAHGQEMAARAPLPKLSWDVPAGWQALPPDGMRKAIFQIAGAEGKGAQVMVIPLPGASNIELESVNMWREELGLDPLKKEQVTEQAQSVQLGDAKGDLFEMTNTQPRAGQKYKTRTLGAIAERENVLWFAKMTGTDDLVAEQKAAFIGFLKSLKFEKAEPAEVATAEGPATTNARQLPAGGDAAKWAVPANWQTKAPGQMITAAYTVTGADGQGEVTVSKFPGDVGGLVANVNRWRQQLGLSPLSDAEARKSAEMLEIDGKKDSYLVDLSGTNARTGRKARMISVGVPRGGETWFYKILGDDALVGKEKDAFLKFIVSAY